jgi:hypothetical protein
MNKVLKANTGNVTIPSSATMATGRVTLTMSPSAPVTERKVDGKKIESAVYAHIQAVRALGRTTINTTEVARALGLSLADVERTLSALRRRGVKTSR